MLWRESSHLSGGRLYLAAQVPTGAPRQHEAHVTSPLDVGLVASGQGAGVYALSRKQ